VYQPAVQGSCDGRTAGMFGKAVMAKPWDGVGTAVMAGTHKGTREGFWVGAMLTLAVKHQWICYKVDKIIKQPCSDFLAHASEVCKGAYRYNEYLAIQGQSRLMGNVYNLCRV
jgi:hypothetical protein